MALRLHVVRFSRPRRPLACKVRRGGQLRTEAMGSRGNETDETDARRPWAHVAITWQCSAPRDIVMVRPDGSAAASATLMPSAAMSVRKT